MDCTKLREHLVDMASGALPGSQDAQQHLRECPACAGQLESLRQTMLLLDEWQAPDPSPYFETRLYARLREQSAQSSRRGLAWLRKPALALALSTLLVVGIGLFRTGRNVNSNQTAEMRVMAQPGTAVGDLQALDKDHEIYSDFNVLDELEVQPDVNP
jgi:hypothetical protein